MKEICYICGSDKFVDGHHYDCQGGKLSSETVPLCRRCHRTYHDWGVGSFSPDTTDKALEVENKAREIHAKAGVRSKFHQPEKPLMKREDVERSSYWYKKHNIPSPSPIFRKKPQGIMPFKIPNAPPLCGEDWLRAHLTDYTPEEIEALTIEVDYDSKRVAAVSVADKRGMLKATLRKK